MKALLKDLYSPAFYKCIGRAFKATIPAFNKQLFQQRIFTAAFEQKELKEGNAAYRFLPVNIMLVNTLLPLSLMEQKNVKPAVHKQVVPKMKAAVLERKHPLFICL